MARITPVAPNSRHFPFIVVVSFRAFLFLLNLFVGWINQSPAARWNHSGLKKPPPTCDDAKFRSGMVLSRAIVWAFPAIVGDGELFAVAILWRGYCHCLRTELRLRNGLEWRIQWHRSRIGASGPARGKPSGNLGRNHPVGDGSLRGRGRRMGKPEPPQGGSVPLCVAVEAVLVRPTTDATAQSTAYLERNAVAWHVCLAAAPRAPIGRDGIQAGCAPVAVGGLVVLVVLVVPGL